MNQVFFNLIVHLFYFIIAVFLIGFAIDGLNRLFYRISGARLWFCYLTGVIGTPIHELSHALACLIFGHKIKEMKLFQIDRSTGTLGYVTHTYNKKNPYHIVGNYFIGVAPILIGTAFLCLMMSLLLPEAFLKFADYLTDFSDLQTKGFSAEWFLSAGSAFWSFITIIFSSVSVGWQWWIFMVLALCVAFHMRLSGADIKSALSALPILILILTLTHIALFFIPVGVYNGFVTALNISGSYLIGMLLLALMLSALPVILAAAVFGILRLFGLRR